MTIKKTKQVKKTGTNPTTGIVESYWEDVVTSAADSSNSWASSTDNSSSSYSSSDSSSSSE